MDGPASHEPHQAHADRPAALLQITPRAIELFEAMERAQRRRNAADCIDDDSGSGSGYCKQACAQCREWWRLYDELYHELHLKPWEWPVMPREKAQAEKPRAPRKLGVPVQCGAGLHQKFATADIRDVVFRHDRIPKPHAVDAKLARRRDFVRAG